MEFRNNHKGLVFVRVGTLLSDLFPDSLAAILPQKRSVVEFRNNHKGLVFVRVGTLLSDLFTDSLAAVLL